MRWAAVDMLRDLPAESLTPWLVTLYTDLDAQSKVYVLNVFRDKVIKDAQRVCIESLDDHSEDVQLAAASALEKIGDGKAILPLAKVASDSRGDLERFSRKALTRLKGKNINAQIAALLGSQESEVQEELIRALVDRNATEAVPVFFAMAGDSDKDVREAAYRGLWALGRLGDLPAVLRLMMKEESTTVLNKAAQAAVALARKAEEPQTPGGAVIRCLPEGALDVNAQKAVLKVLGELGDDNSLFYIRREMRNANEDIREAAARALADWPRETVLPDLMNLAGNTESQILKVLSIRAVLRLIPLKKDMEVEEKLQLYKDLLTLATRAQEKRIALDAVAGLDHPQVQAVIEEYADDPDLKEYAIEAAREKLAMREYAAKDLVPVIKNDMIQCDGDLGEWQKYAFPITSNNRKQKRIDATFRVAWNDKGLAFAVVAKDDPPEFGKDLGMMWSRDCIQVAIDPLNEDKKGGYGPNDLEIGFGFRTRFEGGVHAWHLPASVDEELLENIPMHVGYSSGFITYEIILPWEFLSLMKKEDGYQFGMNIAVTDLDRNRKWIGAQWTPGILEGKSAAFFNTLVLVEKL
jgi:HEAT repeat protein